MSNNDLISREALKEALHNEIGDHALSVAIDRVIDNAPTVEINTNDIEYKAYCKGLEDGKKIARPHGKWIIDGHHRRCNYCNEYTCTEDREGNSIPDNFCPNCGADMKGDTN